MKNSILGNGDNQHIKIKLCKIIIDIYCKYGIFTALEEDLPLKAFKKEVDFIK